MTDANLKLYVGGVEYGTLTNPIIFSNAIAGNILAQPLNPFYLWNDKGGVLDSVPAKTITIELFDMWIQDENLGTSDGSGSQTFTCLVTPVVDNDNEEEIILKVGTTVWERVSSLVGKTPTSEVYTFNTTTGLVTFGNGVEGKIPTLGLVIYLTYMPDLLFYGKEVFENTWLEVKSLGVTTNPVVVGAEQQVSTDASHVTVANQNLLSVTGVWLQSDPGHLHTNYYTGGTFDAGSGIIVLGTPLVRIVTIIDELNNTTTATEVYADHSPIYSVEGVWLSTDPGHIGTNYFTGGSFYHYEITLGTPLPGTPTPVIDQIKSATDTTHVSTMNRPVSSVDGVWLLSDVGHTGTNYYTGGSFDAETGVITLGTPLPSPTEVVRINFSYLDYGSVLISYTYTIASPDGYEPVLVSYSYAMIDDLETSYYPVGLNTSHTFVNPIPKNNAKLLYFRLNVPPDATPSGGSQVNFRLRLSYQQ